LKKPVLNRYQIGALAMSYLGISIGSSSVKACLLNTDFSIVWAKSEAHDGNVQETLVRMLSQFSIPKGTVGLVTGNEGRKQINLPSIIEPEAFEAGISNISSDFNLLVSMGGEDFVVYSLNQGKISNTYAGNKCASGTGEFFKQQLKRMDCGLEAVHEVNDSHKVVKLSSRCSVFMKSDCTHKLNKGEAKKHDIILSLSAVMANKVVEFLAKAKVQKGKALLTGGVTQNPHILKLIEKEKPEIQFIVPKQAHYFEAFGAAIKAKEQGKPLPALDKIFNDSMVLFPRFDSIKQAESLVTYIPSKRGKIVAGKEYILGVDGGSTTTKFALIDYETEEIVAEHYGRTHGDPIQAMRECLKILKEQIKEQIGDQKIKISLVATTGSSREILGVFLETPGVYNEIIAHTVGSTYFNPKIDTIFEIGGQDAKYVYIQNQVPIDYAMNEACSAGTGSFLEESAMGDLNVQSAKDIAPLALKSERPLKFGEHCSAFINSDIRKAIQQGASKEDILAGLVFSIVLNYLNRVVGNRSVGNEIVLQGGVAKNQAMALAFAALLNKKITVPPDPELMGSFGVGILAKQKFENGLLEKENYDIDQILTNVIEDGGEFVCHACENLCPIKIIKLGDKTYHFGGRCSKFTNIRKKAQVDETAIDYIELREKLLLQDFAADFSTLKNPKYKVGVPRAFSIYTLWPFYSHFFKELGVSLELSDKILPEGIQKLESSYCYPAEIAHGAMQDLINKNYDFYFLPHFKDMPSNEDDVHATLCPIMQGMPYFLRTAFHLEEEKLLRPVVSFKEGFESEMDEFLALAKRLGSTEAEGKKAFQKGIEKLLEYQKRTKEIGQTLLKEADPDKTYIVLLGRPYNAFTKDANMGIPRKFHSKGHTIIPFDFMPMEETITQNMYWYYGQQVLKAAAEVAKRPNFFLTYITNFSCAPDSFILHFIRWIQKTKPFLILELDSHSADAGIDTRIEAFLDIIEGYRKNFVSAKKEPKTQRYTVSLEKGKEGVIDSKDPDKVIPFTDKRVKLLWPSMGFLSTQALVSVSNAVGIHSEALPVPDVFTLQLARNVASGKECIPALLVLGSFLQYLAKHKPEPDEILLMFMPITTGPCRTGQYFVFYEQVFQEMSYDNTVVLALNSDHSYSELGSSISLELWWGIVLADYMMDVKTALQVLAQDPDEAMKIFNVQWAKLLKALEKGRKKHLLPALKETAQILAAIPKARTMEEIKKVMVVGEIFVRRDDYSLRTLLNMLADKKVFAKLAGVSEWIYYTDFDRKYRNQKKLLKKNLKTFFKQRVLEKLVLGLEFWYKKRVDHKIAKILDITGCLTPIPHDMDAMIGNAHEKFSHYEFCTEATVSSGVAAEAMEKGYFDGIVIMAPFACLPGRLIEGIYAPYAKKLNHPVIAIENDGNEYSPGLISRIEVFVLNVLRYKKPSSKNKK